MEEKAFIIHPCNRSISLLHLVLSTKLLNSAPFFTYLYPHIFYLHPIVYFKLASLSNNSSSYFQSLYTSGIWYTWYLAHLVSGTSGIPHLISHLVSKYQLSINSHLTSNNLKINILIIFTLEFFQLHIPRILATLKNQN